MKGSVQSDNTNSFGFASLWYNGLIADGASWSKFFVEIVNAMDLVRGVNSKWNSIEALFAHHAGETVWVIRLTGGPKDAIQDCLLTDATLLQCVQVALFTERIAVHSIE